MILITLRIALGIGVAYCLEISKVDCFNVYHLLYKIEKNHLKTSNFLLSLCSVINFIAK